MWSARRREALRCVLAVLRASAMRGVKHRMRLAANDFNEHDNFRGFEMTRTGRTLTIVACVLAMPAAAQAATVHLKSDLLTLKQLPQG